MTTDLTTMSILEMVRYSARIMTDHDIPRRAIEMLRLHDEAKRRDATLLAPEHIQRSIVDLLTMGIEAGLIDPDDDAPGTLLGDVASWLNALPGRIKLVSGHPDLRMEGLP